MDKRTPNYCTAYGIKELEDKLKVLGVGYQYPEAKRVHVLAVTLWCTKKNVPVPEMTKKNPRGTILELKRDIHERLCGSGVSQNVLERLVSIHSKDALLALLFHITAKNIGFERGFLQPSEWSSNGTTNSSQLIQILNAIALAGFPHNPDFDFRPLRIHVQKDSKLGRFVRLPAELREMVWMFVIQSGRIVQIHEGHQRGIKSACPPPITLSINRESRKLALEQYRLGFESRHGPNADTQSPCYFHPVYDTLYLGQRTTLFMARRSIGKKLMEMLSSNDLLQIQHLAISLRASPVGGPPSSFGQLHLFKNLKTMTWVDRDELQFVPHNVEFENLTISPGMVEDTKMKCNWHTGLDSDDGGSNEIPISQHNFPRTLRATPPPAGALDSTSSSILIDSSDN